MKPQPVPGPLYAAAERIVCRLSGAEDRRLVMEARPNELTPLDAALRIFGMAAEHGYMKEVKG